MHVRSHIFCLVIILSTLDNLAADWSMPDREESHTLSLALTFKTIRVKFKTTTPGDRLEPTLPILRLKP